MGVTIVNNLIKKVIKKKIKEDSIHNIRENGQLVSRNFTDNVIINSKKDKEGIDIFVKPDTRGENIFIPVIISNGNLIETVYNDFYIGENSDVTIYAGCAVHNDGTKKSTHNGVHSFYLENNSKVMYIEEHYAEGAYERKDINTITNVSLKNGSSLTFNTVQIQGIDHATRETNAIIESNSSFIANEKLITNNSEIVVSSYKVKLLGDQSKAEINSKSLAKKSSTQEFNSELIGSNKCFGHVSCDAIIMDNAKIKSTPKISAENKDALLSHEAIIGKISTDQVNKLMTLGLNEKEAEQAIIDGFLKD